MTVQPDGTIGPFQYPTGEQSPLSNFYPCNTEVTDQGTWPTIEHYFQAMKTGDMVTRETVRRARTPTEAKRIGRRCQLRPDWEQVKEGVMRYGLAHKFAPGSVLAAWLLSTGEAELVERTTWHDRVWGVCTCAGCHGQGDNLLGLLLMERRLELQHLVVS